MKIYFETAKLRYYLPIKYHLWRKHKVYIFDFDFTARKRKWLRDLIDSKKISKISHYVASNDSLALDNIENVYRFVLRESRFINAMMGFYGSEDITLAYKKTLARKLANCYAVQIVLREGGKGVVEDEKIVFIPYEYLKISKILDECNAFSYKLEDVFIPVWARIGNAVAEFLGRLKDWKSFFFVGVYLAGIVAIKCLVPDRKKKFLTYEYAIPITNPKFQFRFEKNRVFDFLLDHDKIRKDNTVFLLLSHVDKKVLVKLKHDGYNMVDCQSRSVFISSQFGFGKNGKTILQKLFLFVFQNFFYAPLESRYIVLDTLVLIRVYLQWTMILNKLAFSHYITFNDETIPHIGRNIRLNDYGVETWYYAHSSSIGAMHTNKEMDMFKRRHWLWTFLLYDNYAGWNRRVIQYQKLHHQKIKNYHNIGCLWSEFSSDSDMASGIKPYLNIRGEGHKEVKDNMKVVSFFDTSFFDGIASKYPLKDGIKFYKDVFRLLSEDPNLFIIVKEKKPETMYSNKVFFVYSQDNREYSEILKKLKAHARCYVAGHNADPVSIIKVSDLTVTHAFSSSTIEALGARKKAIFYDPANRFRGYYYDDIPNLVAHGYEELKCLTSELLHEVNDREYGEYLNREVLNKVEDYLDGRGLTRFRSLLSKS